MTKHAYKGEPLTDEAAVRIATATLTELDAMSDPDIKIQARQPGTLAKRMGRPRVGGDCGSGPSAQVRVRGSEHTLEALDERAKREHRSRSAVARDALEAYVTDRRRTGIDDIPEGGRSS